MATFLKQALVNPRVEYEKLNLFDRSLSDAQALNRDYVTSHGGTKKFCHYNVNGGAKNLAEFLEDQFNIQHSKYQNYYKVFFFGEAGVAKDSKGNFVGVNGYAKHIKSKTALMFKSANNATTAHELMHCMGLYHSFDNGGRHVFEIKKTENIMDYSHWAQIDRISTWKWQWETLQQSNT